MQRIGTAHADAVQQAVEKVRIVAHAQGRMLACRPQHTAQELGGGIAVLFAPKKFLAVLAVGGRKRLREAEMPLQQFGERLGSRKIGQRLQELQKTSVTRVPGQPL